MTTTAADDQMGIAAVAEMAGITPGAIWKQRDRGTMPEPDGYVARSPWWWESTIRGWMENRPHQGRPPKASDTPQA